jgi:hypothetical protein
MRTALILLTLILLPEAAQAQYRETVCRLLEQYKPSQGVNYQPGVDAYGRAVVPADGHTGGGAGALPETIRVPLDVELAQRLEGAAAKGLEMEAPLGVLEIRTDGQAYVGEQDVSQQLAVLCGQPGEFTDVTTATETVLPEAPVAPVAPAGAQTESFSAGNFSFSSERAEAAQPAGVTAPQTPQVPQVNQPVQAIEVEAKNAVPPTTVPASPAPPMIDNDLEMPQEQSDLTTAPQAPATQSNVTVRREDGNYND